MLRAIRSTLSGPTDDANNSTASSARGGAGEYQAVATSIGDELDDEAEHLELIGQHDKKVYLCFWALGAGVLMSWNALICTIPLLGTFFPPDSAIRGTLASYLSTAYCFGNLFFLGLAQRSVGKTSPSKRLHYALLLLLATALILTFPLLPLVLPRLSPAALFPALIAMTITLSLSTAYLQSAVFALASLWGSNEMIAVMSGQGGIAVLVSGIQWLLAVLSASTPTAKHPSDDPADAASASTLAGVGLWALGSAGTLLCVVAHRYLIVHPGYQAVMSSVINRQAEETAGIGADVVAAATSKNGRGSSLTKKVFMKNLLLETAVAWVFVVTLSVFPPVTTTILSTHVPTPRLLQPDVFIPLHFLLFNIGDYTGRTYLPSIPSLLVTSPPRVLTLSALRTLFIPLLFLCNVSSITSPSSPSPLINSDILYFVVIILFGLTNGYISSLCMIVASSPQLNAKLDEDERDVAGTLTSFCLVAGLAGGSLASFGTSWLMSRG
ncbi:hypothetical protein I317_07433 [Kwoniella heveanensis CBS 569]|nr:hypothetical protein I317_07433 [Kwoniella heveanensis CBS 569]